MPQKKQLWKKPRRDSLNGGNAMSKGKEKKAKTTRRRWKKMMKLTNWREKKENTGELKRQRTNAAELNKTHMRSQDEVKNND